MSGFDNEVMYAENVDFSGASPVEARVTANGQLLIGADTPPNIRVATLTAGTNVSILNGEGTITISSSGGGGGGDLTSIGVDTGTNPVVPDGGDVIMLTGAQVASGTVGTNVIRSNGTGANTVTLQIQQAATAAIATATANGVSHYNSSHFTLGANSFVSLQATIPNTFTADAGSAAPALNNLNVITAANDGLSTSGAGSTITITTTDDLAAIEALATTGYAVRTAANTWALRTFQEGTGIDLTNPAGTAGDTTISVDTSGIPSIPTTFQADSGSAIPALNIINLVGGTNGIDTSAAGSTVTFNFDVSEQPAIATSYPTDSGTATASSNILNILSAASDGIATSGSGDTVTITSANDLAAIEALSGTGFSARTGVETWSLRTLTAGTGVSISNPAGVAGNPTISASADVAITFTGDVGSATPSLNNINILGGEGIDVSGAGSTITIAGEDASTTNKGIASFTAADFDTAAGAVSLEDTVVKLVSSDSGNATPASHTFTIAGTGGIATSGSGSTITIDGSGISATFTWNEVVGTSQAASVDNGYVTNNAGLVTVTLPDTAAFGSIVRVAGKGAGGWRIAQNAGETIHFLSQSTTTGVGGRLDSTTQYDSVELLCITANTVWVVLQATGNITVT